MAGKRTKPTLSCWKCGIEKGKAHFHDVDIYHKDYRLCITCMPKIHKIRNEIVEGKKERESRIYRHNQNKTDFSQYFMLDGYLGAEHNFEPFTALILGQYNIRESYIKKAMEKMDVLDYNLSAMSKWEFDELRDDVAVIYVRVAGIKSVKLLRVAFLDYFLNYVK